MEDLLNNDNLIMKKLLLIGVFTITFFAANAQVKNWTLQECVVYALENNISVKQSELDVQATALERSDAVGNFLPSINASSSVSKTTGLGLNPVTNQLENRVFLSANGGVNLGYTLFDGLRNVRQVQRADISQLASQYRLEKMKDDIALFVANSYLQVLLNKANLEVVLTQNDVTKNQIVRTQQLVNAGSIPRGDLLEIQATNASELQRIAVAENAVQISLISLAQLLLIKDYANFDIANDDFNVVNEEIADTPVSTLIESAKENRQEIRIAESQVALAEKDIQISKGALLPTVNAFFGYDTRYSDGDINTPFKQQIYINDGVGYGLSLSVPILNGFRARNN
ncbi:MAG: outer membrane protein, partial [Patiriisocius sp.]